MVLSAATTARGGSPLAGARRRYRRGRLRYRTWRACGRRYAAPIDPFGLLRLDPGAVSRVVSREDRATLAADGDPDVQAVAGGDWDLGAEPFVESRPFRALRDRFVRGRPWDAIEAEYGVPSRVSPATLEVLCADVATRGYRTVRERRRERREPAAGPTLVDPRPDLPPAKAEVRVAVGRDGRFVLHDGGYRLAVARLLGVESLPVHVLVRHDRWQARRERVVLTGADASDHPDLTDLSPRAAVGDAAGGLRK
ncbi:hypothetical protein [Salinilacihabitans rarus]|uniref:hypothetical protein n=1 Tax=Salinilacihabitans rarus TaxID=2961596 RepID=UPI0020C8448A|nr:hypothetical protein [Salinilacihabitans rarus]